MEFLAGCFQIPDAEPGGLVAEFSEAIKVHDISQAVLGNIQFHRLSDVARALEAMLMENHTVVLDEFQYLNHAKLKPLLSYLQSVVDQFQGGSRSTTGGLIVAGSIHTEMEAILSDKSAPLYGRVTHLLDVNHFSPSTVRSILRDHDAYSPEALLFYFNLIEGVPKYYQTAFEHDLLGRPAAEVVKGLFIEPSSPLRSEAENWFLHGIKGRNLAILNAIAHLGGSPYHSDLLSYMAETSEGEKAKNQVGSYLEILQNKYRIVVSESPIFTKKRSRFTRHRLSDNFLQAWLGCIKSRALSVAFRNSDELAEQARESLLAFEGKTLERMFVQGFQKQSSLGAQGKNTFLLDEAIAGYWNEVEFEIDLIFLNHTDRRLRLGSCRRQQQKLMGEGKNLERKATKLLGKKPFSQYKDYRLDFALCTTQLSPEVRKTLESEIPGRVTTYDLEDVLEGLPEE